MKIRFPRIFSTWALLCLLVCAGASPAFAQGPALPLVSIADASIGEGDGRADPLVFVITLTEPSAQAVVIPYETQAVTATPGVNFAAGTDFNQASGQVTIPAGATWALLKVETVPDASTEPNETLRVVLSNPSNAQLADGEAVGTILDDDGAVFTKVHLASNTFTVSEVAGKIDFLVTRTGDVSGPSAVNFATGSIGASDREDYTPTVGTLRFAPNETSKTVTVGITNDAYKDSFNKQLFFVLYEPAGCTLGSPAFTLGTIESDDAADGPSPVGAAFDNAFFVRQHYWDFLGREPDAEGLAHWTNVLNSCGSDAQCREVTRINVSAAFFLSIEFQETSYLVYRTYKAAFGNLPGKPVPITLYESLRYTQQISRGVVVNQGDWKNQLEQNKRDYFDAFVRALTFPLIHRTTLTPAQFVDQLFLNAGVTPTADERQAALDEFGGAATSADPSARARALRRVAESPALIRQELNRAFVLSQYFGYLRRNPDDLPDRDFSGYDFWLGNLDRFNGNFEQAELVKAFITSVEYHRRFGL